MATASPDSEDPVVIEVAVELQAAAGKRDRDGADVDPEETARLEEEEGAFEADVERLRKMKLAEKPKMWVGPLEMEVEEQAAGTTHCINNSSGKKKMDDAGGPKRGRESLDGVCGADRITRSRSVTSGRDDTGVAMCGRRRPRSRLTHRKSTGPEAHGGRARDVVRSADRFWWVSTPSRGTTRDRPHGRAVYWGGREEW